MSVATWTIKAYNLSGTPITAIDSYDTGGTVSEVLYAIDRKWTIPLNGIDQFDFGLYLDDDMATKITPLKTVIKVWRTINDPVYGKSYSSAQPDFVGVVGYRAYNGEENTVRYSCFNPMWRLQFHFHILNHFLVKDTAPGDANHQGANVDGEPFDQSALMFRLIDLTNGAWGNHETGPSATGIVRPLSGPPYWEKTIEEAPFAVAKGQNTWSLIFDNILSAVSGVDLTPEYYHSDGSARLMYFATAPARGVDRGSGTTFDYHMGNYNCTNMTDEVIVEVGKFANYLWAVGQGGPNKAYAVEEDISGTWGRNNTKIYMRVHDASNEVSATTEVGAVRNIRALKRIAAAELTRAKYPTNPVVATLSPAVPPYYMTDFETGDVVRHKASKGAMSIDAKKRIYQTNLSMSDNNWETAEILASDDFESKVAVT